MIHLLISMLLSLRHGYSLLYLALGSFSHVLCQVLQQSYQMEMGMLRCACVCEKESHSGLLQVPFITTM